MSDYWEAWLFGGDTYDRRTRAEVDAVRDSESRARSQLAHQMRAQQGNLQGQLDRLTEAFVALVEYEDIRGELNEHAESAACRKYAREVVGNLVVTGGSGLAGITAPPAVHDYWLSWAVTGLVTSATGGEGAESLARAERLDAERTGLLLVLLDAIRREQRFGQGHLDVVLPDAADVSRVDRAIWCAVTDGRLGEAAVPALEERLRTLLGTPDVAAVEAWVRGLPGRQRDVPDSVVAERTLVALERLLDPAAGSAQRYTVGPDDDSPTTDATPATTPAATPAATPQEASEDPLADALMSLVDEGAPGENLILTRMSEVRARMGFVEARAETGAREAVVGSVLDLLLRDLADTGHADRRSLAARLLGPTLLPVVQRLGTEAAVAPEGRMLHVSGTSITIAADGTVDPGWRARLEQKIRQEQPANPLLRPGAYAAFAAGVLSLGLVLLSPAWLVLTIALLGTGAGLLLYERTSARDAEAAIARRLERADRDVSGGAAQQAEIHAQSVAAGSEAEQVTARLVGHLGSPTARPGAGPGGRHVVA